MAVEPVWYLRGVAERFGITESQLRRNLFEQTGGMFPELVTRPDLQVFLPPIGGITVYMMGDVFKLEQKNAKLPAVFMMNAMDQMCLVQIFALADHI